MKKLFYPAIFHKAEEGGFWITFPDLPECITEGDDLNEAYEMASDALGLCLSDIEESKMSYPKASNPSEITLEKDSFVVVIEFDLDSYRRKHCSKSVKKTLSIPQWLNEKAISMNINFSQVLQESLLERIEA